ncbi:MAG: peptidoglycan-binding domain-containing protein [Candidatus Paceibacterota bacterium]
MLKKFLIGTFALALMLSASVALAYDFGPSTLKVGSKGEFVKTLQTLVGAEADGSFGPMTAAKVKVWQAANGLTADGVFGNLSKAKANAGAGVTYAPGCSAGTLFSSTTGLACTTVTTGLPAGCTSTVGYSSTTGDKCDGVATTPTGPLVGTVGSITVTPSSSYSAENVGQGDVDAKVMAFKVEADNDSDVSISSVKVELKQTVSTNSRRITDYVKTVSVFQGSTKVGEVNAADFSEASHIYTKTVPLTGAVVRAGKTETFSVSVTSLSTLDSGDIDDDSFGVDVLNVRFVDGQGVVTTEDTDASALDQTFDFDTFATANAVELKVSLNDSDKVAINDAHVIDVETGAVDTKDVPVLSFKMKAVGSDINVTEIPVTLTTAGDTNEANLVITARLFLNGDEIDSESVVDGGAVTFNDLDFNITDGSTANLKVLVDLQDLTGALDVGDTIKAEVTTANVDAILATDESGEDLAAGDLTGAALGTASEVRDVGINLKLVSTTAVKTAGDAAATTPTSDEGDYSITFDVTAFDGDVWLDNGAPDETGTLVSQVSDNGTGTFTGTLTSANNLTGTDGYKILEGTTERFTLSGHTLATASGYFKLSITDLIYALTDATGDIAYTFNLGDFQSNQLYLTDR